MMNDIQIFNNPEFGNVRTLEIGGKPYFCGSDVASALGYSNVRDAISRHCKGVVKRDTPTSSGIQSMSYIPEGDIYRLIARSKLPTAEKFESWVFDEVIPSIRKNGGYIANQENLTPEQIVANALIVAQNIISKKDEKIMALEQETVEMSRTITEMQPKVNYVDMILQSKSTVCTTQIAQDYGMTATAFNKTLRDLGVQHKVAGQWILYRQYLDQGYVQSETVKITRRDGTPDTVMNTKWTQKGRLFLYELLKTNDIYPLIEKAA